MSTSERNVDHATRIHAMLDAIERGDRKVLLDQFIKGAKVWHNFDEVDVDIEHVVATALANLIDNFKSRKFMDRRIWQLDDMAFLQQALVVEKADGTIARMPAAMRIVFDREGYIARIEEYIDTAQHP